MAVNADLVKAPYQTESYSYSEMTELAKCAADPKYFITNHCWLQHPTQGKMRFVLYDFQEELIDSYHNHRSSISLLSRQMGKSQCAAAYLLWFAMFKPDSTILIAAHIFAGASEIMTRIRYMYENCPDYIRAGILTYNKQTLEFDNGSRITARATTENTGRGMALTLVYLDEFAFVMPRVAAEFWTALSPTLSTGGKCIITSTPNQDDDQFAQIWNQANKTVDAFGNETVVGVNGFKSFMATWDRHPDRDDAWAAAEEAKITPERFAREHLCLVGDTSIYIMDDNGTIVNTKMQNLFGGIYSSPVNGQIFKENKLNLKVLTDTGYQYFSGISYMGEKDIYRLEMEDDYYLECTDDHNIYLTDGRKIAAIDLIEGDKIVTIDGDKMLTNAFYTNRTEPVYDLIGVEHGNRFFGNNVLVSNCQFIAFDETLINSMFLSKMDIGHDPITKTGQIRWYETISADKSYVVALDPSLGTGGDPAAIQVFSLPDLKQVAEWQHNKTPIQQQIKIMKQMIDIIEEQSPDSELYYSVENNTLGEAALVSISEMGEENIGGVFLSEPRRTSSSRKYRKGYTTTASSKLASCAKLKRWIEESYLTVNSKNLVRELKTFIARGNSYSAKVGETDDLVMATILIVRMIMQISKYDEATFMELKDSFDEGESRDPLPFIIM
jgi:hypothetical protein